MKKRGLCFAVFLIAIFMFSYSSAEEIRAFNNTLKKTYSASEIISGTINLSLKDVNAYSNVSSNQGQSILLKDFLDENDARYNCTSSGCGRSYSIQGGGDTEKTLNIGVGVKGVFGFYVQGDYVTIDSFNFNLASNFGSSSALPLMIEFFDGSSWKFDYPSLEPTRQTLMGCYNGNSTTKVQMINTRFCNKISDIPETRALRIGADIAGSDGKKLDMLVYSLNGVKITNCSITPEDDNACWVYPNGQAISNRVFEGDYYVCVMTNQTTNYNISKETAGEKCGWANSSLSGFSLPSSFSADYSIFAKVPKFASAESLDFNSSKLNMTEKAKSYLRTNYNNHCSNGCVFPFIVYGINQSLIVKDIVIEYRADEGGVSREVFDISPAVSLLNFSGVLDLSKTGFDVGAKGSKNFIIEIEDTQILRVAINVSSALVINSVSPEVVPAGIPSSFVASVSGGNISLYKWDFGDSTAAVQTSSNIASHTYTREGVYTLVLEASGTGGIKSSKSFTIIAGNPKDSFDSFFAKKESMLNKTTRELNNVTGWYKNALIQKSRIDYYRDELARIKTARTGMGESDNYLNITIRLNNLDVPSSVYLSESSSYPFYIDVSDIAPEAVKLFSGENGSVNDAMKDAIWQWQYQKINVTISMKKYSISRESSSQELLSVYKFDINSAADSEGYLIVKSDNVTFNADTKRVSGDYSSVSVPTGRKIVEFSVSDSEGTIIFMSPKLSVLGGEFNVEECNFNKICEEDLDEDYKNCRSDCKPYGMMIFWMSMALLFVLILYTIIQEWYKARYETHLFKDRRHLFNVLMFIANARARGMQDSEIRDALKSKSWTGEQISYAIKKSRGQRTGMFEIIPIEKIFAHSRKKEAEKRQASGGMPIAAPNMSFGGWQPKVNK